MAKNSKLSAKQQLELIGWSLKTAWQVDPIATLLMMVSKVVMQITNILDSYFIAYTITSLSNLESYKTNTTLYILVFFIVLRFFAILSNNVYDTMMFRLNRKGQWAFERRQYEALNNVSFPTIENPEFNNIYMRGADGKMKILELFNAIIEFAGGIIRIVSISVILFANFPWHISALVLLVIPRYMIVGQAIKEVWRFTIGETENRKRYNAIVNTLKTVVAQVEIRITQGFKYLDKLSHNYFNTYYAKETRLQGKRALLSGLLMFLNTFIIASAIYITIQNYISGKTDIGQISFVLMTFTTLSGSLSGITSILTSVLEVTVKVYDFKKIIDIEKESLTTKASSEYKSKLITAKKYISNDRPSLIEFNDVTFTYPGRNVPALKNINFSISPGEKIAIVGHNGAGKTTLIKLLLKLYNADKGQIRVNSQNLGKIPGTLWSNHVAGLMQNYNIYEALSIADNVFMGNSQSPRSEDRIIECLTKAELINDISKLENGINTIAAPRFAGGTDLSTGQKQKLAIARFLYNDSPIVIFDEPTASIDASSESKIFNNIFETLADKSVIIISHRFSTVRKADRILVIENGEIVEQGKHSELISKDGVYAKSYKLQADGYKD